MNGHVLNVEQREKQIPVDNTPENREKLAQHVVSNMSLEEILERLFDDLVEEYDKYPDNFIEDCEAYGFSEEDS